MVGAWGHAWGIRWITHPEGEAWKGLSGHLVQSPHFTDEETEIQRGNPPKTPQLVAEPGAVGIWTPPCFTVKNSTGIEWLNPILKNEHLCNHQPHQTLEYYRELQVCWLEPEVGGAERNTSLAIPSCHGETDPATCEPWVLVVEEEETDPDPQKQSMSSRKFQVSKLWPVLLALTVFGDKDGRQTGQSTTLFNKILHWNLFRLTRHHRKHLQSHKWDIVSPVVQKMMTVPGGCYLALNPLTQRGLGPGNSRCVLDLLLLFEVDSSPYLSVCVCVCAKSLQSCPTLCNPVDWNPPGCSVLGTLQARRLEWVALPSSRGPSRSRGSLYL